MCYSDGIFTTVNKLKINYLRGLNHFMWAQSLDLYKLYTVKKLRTNTESNSLKNPKIGPFP